MFAVPALCAILSRPLIPPQIEEMEQLQQCAGGSTFDKFRSRIDYNALMK